MAVMKQLHQKDCHLLLFTSQITVEVVIEYVPYITGVGDFFGCFAGRLNRRFFSGTSSLLLLHPSVSEVSSWF